MNENTAPDNPFTTFERFATWAVACGYAPPARLVECVLRELAETASPKLAANSAACDTTAAQPAGSPPRWRE